MCDVRWGMFICMAQCISLVRSSNYSGLDDLVRSCKMFLAGSAWLLLSKTCISFQGPLYESNVLSRFFS